MRLLYFQVSLTLCDLIIYKFSIIVFCENEQYFVHAGK